MQWPRRQTRTEPPPHAKHSSAQFSSPRFLGFKAHHMAHVHRYGDDLDVSVNIAAVADYLEDCARAQAAKPPPPPPDHSLRHLVCAVCRRPHLTGSLRLTQSRSDCPQRLMQAQPGGTQALRHAGCTACPQTSMVQSWT
jgi:hypothetical protein